MAKTRTDLIHRALKNLGVLPQGQNPSAEEYNTVNDLVDPVVEDLIERDVFFLEDVDAIPEAPFMHLGHILAWASAPEFGMHNDTGLAALAKRAEVDLGIIQATRPTYKPLAVQPY